jgi:hypothetical protein
MLTFTRIRYNLGVLPEIIKQHFPRPIFVSQKANVGNPAVTTWLRVDMRIRIIFGNTTKIMKGIDAIA